METEFRNQEWNLSDTESITSSTQQSQMSIDDDNNLHLDITPSGSRKRKSRAGSIGSLDSNEQPDAKKDPLKRSSIIHLFFEKIQTQDKLKHQCILCK